MHGYTKTQLSYYKSFSDPATGHHPSMNYQSSIGVLLRIKAGLNLSATSVRLNIAESFKMILVVG